MRPYCLRIAGIVLVLTSFAAARPTGAQTPVYAQVNTPQADNDIFGMIRRGDTVYAVGRFTSVHYSAPNTMSFDKTTAKFDRTFQPPDPCSRLEPDGSGGVYCAYGSVTRLQSSGVPDPNFVSPTLINAIVENLSLCGGRLYIAGGFSSINGQPRNRVAVLDAATGELTPTDLAVFGIFGTPRFSCSNGVLYLSGDFTGLSGVTRYGLAAIDAATGSVLPWDPAVSPSQSTHAWAAGDQVYLAGTFTSVGGQPRSGLASVDPVTAAVTSFSASYASDGGFQPVVSSIVRTPSRVWIGGHFQTVNGSVRRGLAALDPTTGALAAPDAGLADEYGHFGNQLVYALAADGETVYVLGQFSFVGGARREQLAAINQDAVVTAWDPGFASYPSGTRFALSGQRLVFSTSNTGVRVNKTPRLGAFAFDIISGEILPWNPNLAEPADPDEAAGYSIVDAGSRLWIGGRFTEAGSPARAKKDLVAVDPVFGQPILAGNEGAAILTSGFRGVIDLAYDPPRSRVWGIASFFFGVDAVTGIRAVSNVPPINSQGLEQMAIEGPSLYFGVRPSFQKANLSTASVVPWPAPQLSQGFVTGMEVATDVYLTGPFGSLGSVTRTGLAAIDATTGAVKPWAPVLGGDGFHIASAQKISLNSGRAVVCGPFYSVNGSARTGIASIGLASGTADSWSPVVDTTPVCTAILASSDRVVVAGSSVRTSPLSFTRSYQLAVVPSPLAAAGNADLSIGLSAAPDPATVAGLLTYTVVVNNLGPDASSQASAAVTFGPSLLIQSFSSAQGSCTSSVSSVSCALGGLGSGGQATMTIVVRTLQAGTASASATVSGLETDPNSSNNQASTVTTVSGTGAETNLSLSMTATTGPVILGNPVTYSLTLANSGPGAATNIVLTNQFPSNVNLTSITIPQGSCSGTTLITCTIPTLAAGAQIVIQLVGTSTAVGNALNQANVYFDGSDPAPSNNTAFASTAVLLPGANLAVAMTAAPFAVFQGQTVTFSIAVANAGPSVANNAVLTNPVPSGTVAISAVSSTGSCTLGATITCTLGALGSGASASVTIVLRANQQGTLNNTASVTSGTTDPDTSDNTAGASVSVGPPAAAIADLGITLTATPDPAGTSLPIAYTAVATNSGPDTAVATSVSLTLPAGATLLSATTTDGSCAGSGPVVCSIPAFANGATATITVNLTVPAAGSAAVTASISSSAGDPVPANDSATATVAVVDSADLALTLVDAVDPVSVGSVLGYTLTVTNNGTLEATGVTLTDLLPAEVTLLTATPSQGSCSGTGTVTCALGTIAVGGSATVVLAVTVTAAGSIVNTATVSGAEFDALLANNTAVARTRAGSFPQLRLTKSHTGNFVPGQNGTFTLTLTNAGAGSTGLPGTPIRVGSVANARFGNDWTLDGLNMVKTRDKLLSASNFGAGGTVPRAIEITSTFAAKGSMTHAALNAFDTFFVGYFFDTAPDAFTAAELQALKAWVNDGGNLVTTCDSSNYDNVCAAFGYPVLATLDTANPMTPTPLGVPHPAFSGPFGGVSSFVGNLTIGYFFSSLGADVLARDPAGVPVVLEKTFGQGKVIFLSDVDFISTAATAGSAISSANDRLLANLFAHAGRAATIHVGDFLPTGLSFVSASGTGWTCIGPGCLYTGTLAPGASTSLTLTAFVAPGATGPLTNRAVLTSSPDTNAGDNVAIDTVSLASGAAVPSVNLVVPPSGPVAGGTPVTIYGSNFESGATVRFAAGAATGVTVVNAATITATTPAGPPGPVDVSVTNTSSTSFARPAAFLYLAPETATQFYTVVPCRIVDTRGPAGPFGAPALAANQTRTFALSGSCGIPADAVALSLNITALSASTAGEFVLAPSGISTPGTSAASFRAAQTRANNTLIPVNGLPVGSLSVTAKMPSGSVDLIIDVNGYFR